MSVIKSAMIVWQLRAYSHVNLPSMIYWNSTRPLEIKLVIHTSTLEADDVEWVFGRDLLLDAFQWNEAGLADVRVAVNSDGLLILDLSSPFGAITLQTEAEYVQKFLLATLAVIPRGHEDCDVDRAIKQILEEAG